MDNSTSSTRSFAISGLIENSSTTVSRNLRSNARNRATQKTQRSGFQPTMWELRQAPKPLEWRSANGCLRIVAGVNYLERTMHFINTSRNHYVLGVLPEAVTVSRQSSQVEANMLRAEKRERGDFSGEGDQAARENSTRSVAETTQARRQPQERQSGSVLEQLSSGARPVVCIRQLVILHWGEVVTAKNAHGSQIRRATAVPRRVIYRLVR